MTRRDILQTAHEPFGDAFYYGPERLSVRFADDEEARLKSGFSKSTYKTIMDRLEGDGKEVRLYPLLNCPSEIPCPLSVLCVDNSILAVSSGRGAKVRSPAEQPVVVKMR